MSFSVALFISLALCLGGVLYKVSRWFKRTLYPTAEEGPGVRLSAALRGLVSTLLSLQGLRLLKVFALDVLLQMRVLREDPYRWVMHLCLYWGFLLLLLTHAVGGLLFEEYIPPLNPLLFLRDLFAAVVLLGMALAVYRRWGMEVPRLVSNSMDLYAIVAVALIIVSGFLLEGVKITSRSVYLRMVQEYADLSTPEEERALEAYWVAKFGLISPAVKGPVEEGLLRMGEELHEMSCAGCHSRPRWAFLGYGVARAIKPVALPLDRAGAAEGLWWVHVLACLVALAFLPFSKFFHLLTAPLCLLCNAVMERGRSSPANLTTKRMIELDACTHCGTCTVRCSAAPVVEVMPNSDVLPSEKIASLKVLASGKELSRRRLEELLEGIYLCTNCYRCTVVCPVGIDLQDLWFEAREALFRRGVVEVSVLSPLSFFRGLMRAEVEEGYEVPLAGAKEAIAARFQPAEEPIQVPTDAELQGRLDLSADARTFHVCFSCQTCSNACPVVANYDDPEGALGLLPHQIMRACALGLRELAFRAEMLWRCLTCYQCQELCPQGVRVADVLYELKTLVVESMKGKEDEVRPLRRL